MILGVRIIVDARNFVDKGQKYSLAITGCFSEIEKQSTMTASAATTPATKPASAERSSCPSNRIFQLTLNTADDGGQLSWNLIGSTSNAVEWRAALPSSAASLLLNCHPVSLLVSWLGSQPSSRLRVNPARSLQPSQASSERLGQIK